MKTELEDLLPVSTEKYPSLLIFGPPGSGKGTLGRFLSSAGSHFHLSSGDIFRGIAPESPAGQLYQRYAHKGQLLPDDATIAIWRNYVQGLIATNRYFPRQQLLLLDGIPRTLSQAKILESYVKVAHIIILETPNQKELIKRMQRRAMIERRADDMDEGILRARMEIYERDTVQVLSHYPKSVQSRFNADQRPLEVLRDVLVTLSDILSKKKIDE